ncbi:glycoside hydrolase family 3 N-terminal domain-containing protein [Chamaesiphon minutus]|uniref:beta-N-acetylhexosaminidase n=1 Tax=Chamaesiphon minutus (strain ATCC 27169 / PCC 6605) TaxID=1173020 RepID=K9UA84_CHAP6|nr:glycoside hydrolase family 3 N-terminal domain-containing protein [Chamaesiphon minutus]AFY91533.1 beta-glucosidase-like glycosyl hydrolase [Chamaesiphon minutus PCC 6605]
MKLPNPNTLTLAQQVAQMVVVRASSHLFDHQIQYPEFGERDRATLKHWIADLGVGGVIFWGGNAGELTLRIQQLQAWANYPLLIAADIEEGVGQRFTGATWFPPPMALNAIAQTDLAKAIDYARQMGAITAQEALAVGINWILAPVVDVNNNPANPVINIRAFGETPDIVSQLATAYIRGAADHPVLTCAKHFPGHGDTGVDSHWALPTIPHDRARLNSIELPPFKAAIQAGVDSVMSAHLLIPALDAELPATLSPKILTEELRQNLGFEGLISTDALVMGAIADRYGADEAPVMSVTAGSDIILMPVDPEIAIRAVCNAVESGRISAERIRASVGRIWRAKQKLFQDWDGVTLTQSPVNSQPAALTTLAAPTSMAIAKNALQDSLIMQGNLPLKPSSGKNIVVLEEILDSTFLSRSTPAVTIPTKLGYQLQLINRHSPAIKIAPDESVILQLFIRTSPFSGGLGITSVAKQLFQQLIASQQLQGLIIYGSPYLMADFAPHLPPEIPCVFCYGQMAAAQSIALTKLFGYE